jgi:hypothetical protein
VRHNLPKPHKPKKKSLTELNQDIEERFEKFKKDVYNYNCKP